MRKIYLFVALVMAMFVLTPAKAAVKSATDLFGKWSFKANIEFTDNSYKDKIFGESDVVIKADPSGTFVAEIDGLCGVEDSYQVVSKLEEVDGMQTLRVVNPNGGGWDAWGSLGLWMADIEGNNPFGMDSYGPLNYVINDAGTEITMADFSFVKISDFNADKGEIIAKVTGIKLTLVEREEIVIADLSGSYEFNATTFHDYGVIAGWPTTLTMNITKKDDTNKNYSVSWTWKEFGTINFDGTFDGNTLSLPYSKQLVTNDSIYLAPSNGYTLDGAIGFNLKGENLSLSTGVSFAVPYYKEGSEEVDSLSYIFWYGAGIAKLPREEPTFTYDGIYKAVGSVNYDTGAIETPSEGNIVIAYNDQVEAYVVTEFMGFKNPYTLDYDLMYFIPDSEDPLKGSLTCACLNFVGQTDDGKDYRYLAIRDGNLTDYPIPVTLDENGNMTIKDLCFATITWMGTESDALVKWFGTIKATKYVPSAQDWIGTHDLTPVSFAYVMDGANVPTTGNIAVDYYEATDEYLASSILGYDLYSMNYGGLLLTISKDNPHKATMDCGIADFDATTYESIEFYDTNLKRTPIELTLNDDGTVTIGDFAIAKGPWGSDPTTLIASTKEDTGISTLGMDADDSESTLTNLGGLRVTDDYKGIVIKRIGGKAVKMLNK